MKKITFILALLLLITGFLNAQAIIVDGQLYGGVGAPGESGEWGSITGTLSDQMDLQSALNLKLNTSSYTSADVLAKILTVDGSGSGLDADLLGGVANSFYAKTNVDNMFSTSQSVTGDITASGTVSGANPVNNNDFVNLGYADSNYAPNVTEAHETLDAIGAETTWELTNTPNITKHYWITRNGVTLYEDAAGDFTLTGNTITWNSALLAGDIIQIWYKY